jgi:hypothetical protein
MVPSTFLVGQALGRNRPTGQLRQDTFDVAHLRPILPDAVFGSASFGNNALWKKRQAGSLSYTPYDVPSPALGNGKSGLLQVNFNLVRGLMRLDTSYLVESC